MKKTLILLLTVGYCSSIALASNPELPVIIFKFSPQHMIRSGLWLSAEFFNEHHNASSQLSVEALYSKPVGKVNGIVESSGFTVEYMFRYFPGKLHIQKQLQKETVKGFYVGIFGQAGSYTQKDQQSVSQTYPKPDLKEVTSIKTTSFYPGFTFGLEQSLGESIYLDLYVGAGMRISHQTITSPITDYQPSNYFFLYNNGVVPKIGLSLGIGF